MAQQVKDPALSQLQYLAPGISICCSCSKKKKKKGIPVMAQWLMNLINESD